MGGPLRPIIISITGPGGAKETRHEDGERRKESQRDRRARVEGLRSRGADRRRGFAVLSGRKLTTERPSPASPADQLSSGSQECAVTHSLGLVIEE